MKTLLMIVLTCIFNTVMAAELPLHLLTLPKGFKITLFASVPNAREMALGDKGTVFVGSLQEGKVYAIIPQSKKVLVIASNLTMPNGVAFQKGSLYVSANNQILRFDTIEDHLEKPLPPVVVTNTLPSEKEHGWRYIAFGPDSKLYIGVGMPCNICLPQNPIFGTIIRMNPDGSDLKIVASGVRNTVGFDWDSSKQLWFTENGRDLLGDNTPPDKINHLPQEGLHFGFPYANGKNLLDPEFGKYGVNKTFVPPTYELPAHVAPLGLVFYRGTQFPKEFHNQMFIAEHGSWNRSTKVGYQIIFVEQKDNKVVSIKPFITGWLQDQKVWGRPVALLNLPDGSLLLSDDFAGVVYQVTYKE
jgi:glucose/arabinose dehydrogenase